MYAQSFEYHTAGSVRDAVGLLGQYGEEAKLLAGGHSLVPLMKLRFAQPRHLIDIRRIPELRGVREDGEGLVIGALTTYREMIAAQLLRQRVPLLSEAAAQVGDMQVRNMGTLGGSLAHADPAADMPAAILALECSLVAVGPRGERSIPAEEFFVTLMTTALEPDEVLTQVRVPVPRGRVGSAYEKYAHPASGYALCGAAAVLSLDGQGRVERARVALTGVGLRASRAVAVEEALHGREPDEQALRAAAERATEGIQLRAEDAAARGHSEQIARVYTRRALQRAAERAGGTTVRGT